MDLELAIITALYNAITSDSDLQVAFGGAVRLHLVRPDEDDPALPYLAHRLTHKTGDSVVVRPGLYYLDVWDYSETAERVYAIREAIMALLDKSMLSIPGLEAEAVRFRIRDDGFIPEDTPGIWHYAFMFDVRYVRTSELTVS